MTAATGKQRSPLVLALVVIAACAFFFVMYGLYVYEATKGGSVTVGQVIYNLYAYGGFSVICMAGLAVTALVPLPQKAVWSRIFIWGIILLGYHFATQFFANAFNMALMTFQTGLIFASEYIPFLLLTGVLIALLCQWNTQKKTAVNTLAWVGLLVSSFCSGWFIYHTLTSMISMDAIVLCDVLLGVSQALLCSAVIAFVFCATRSAAAFAQSFRPAC